MENVQKMIQKKEFFTPQWFSQELSLVTGIYHLMYDGAWSCIHANDNCFEVLKCSKEQFLNIFQKLDVLTEYGAPEKTMEEILEEAAVSSKSCSFISMRVLPNGESQCIKGTLSAAETEKGMSVYGQITDVTKEYVNNAYMKRIEEAYESSLYMSGKTPYRYEIKGRRGVVPKRIAKRHGMPEVIDNVPEWGIESGRIAPQSADAWLNLFDSIDKGEKQGAADVVFQVYGGEIQRRVSVEFVGLTDEHGVSTSAIVSHRDITDEYERDKKSALDRSGLIQVAQMAFSEIFSLNLTNGQYRILQNFKAPISRIPQEGDFHQLLVLWLEKIIVEDQQVFRDKFFPEGMKKAIEEGNERIQLTYRRLGRDGLIHWIETIAVVQDNPYSEDIVVFTVSRNVDQQKAQEELLRQALADSTEKLEGWLYYNSLSSQHFPGLIYVNYNDGRVSPYSVGGLAKKLDCPAKELALGTCFRIPKEEQSVLKAAYEQAIRDEKQSFRAEYRVESDRGEVAWVLNEAVYFKDKEGDTGYIHFLTDTTLEHTLMEQLQIHMDEQMKENEQIFHIVGQHSRRMLYAYDVETGMTRPWDKDSQEKDILAHIYNGNYSESALEFNHFIMPDCKEEVKQFFTDIHSGVPSGEMNVHVQLQDGKSYWYHFRYSILFSGSKPKTALISIEDITADYELKISHIRLRQSLEQESKQHLSYMEADLTDDRIEKFTGIDVWSNISVHGEAYSIFLGNYYFGLVAQDCVDAHVFYSRENLLAEYWGNHRHLENIWQAEREQGNTWVKIKTDLIADPFSGHIKMYSRMLDVTEEQEEKLAVNKRADFDGMTGLLRRDAGEYRMKKSIGKDEQGGILIILDLDDLKGINDTLGHKAGDAAIIGIANTLKRHFRSSDILTRIGGDEFAVFLPGAAQNVKVVEKLMASLLRKLSSIYIGEKRERTIHCSAGCAVEKVGADSYDALFKRADTALYHVKRNGKNHFAFYESDMTKEDFEFYSRQLLSTHNVRKFEQAEMQYLLDSIATFYQLMLSVNLSKNHYYIMEEIENGVFSKASATGELDSFIHRAAAGIHPDDVNCFFEHLSREALMKAYAEGEKNIRYHFRFHDGKEYRWIESVLIFYSNNEGDVCGFTMLRWADKYENVSQEERRI